jgi:hypothetical protein
MNTKSARLNPTSNIFLHFIYLIFNVDSTNLGKDGKLSIFKKLIDLRQKNKTNIWYPIVILGLYTLILRHHTMLESSLCNLLKDVHASTSPKVYFGFGSSPIHQPLSEYSNL